MARRDEGMERRLLNWARWVIGNTSGSMGYASVTMADRVDCDRQGHDAQARIPTNDCEASETDEAIATLERDLQATLLQVYVKARGARENARLLGVSEATVKARVVRAHQLLAAYFVDRAERLKAERGRVEALQRVRVPFRGGFTH